MLSSVLYNLIITPIETLAGWIFSFMLDKFRFLDVIGAVFGVSLAINFLALPLYNIADSLQERERNIARKLEARVKRIKQGFKGDEQFMMLQTYYKQNNYHPLYALRSSLSILIEIPFFIAAYHFLSHNEVLRGASFWIFKDLGDPDGLLHIGNFPVHVLPVLMTLINLVSGAVYTRGAPAREKIQLYCVAGIFLVLLYNSPSGLVIYWILNNLFSLIKNIVLKMKNPGRILHGAISVLMLLFTMVFWFFKPNTNLWKKLVLTAFACAVIILPLAGRIFGKKQNDAPVEGKENNFWFTLTAGFALALLGGLVLPSSVISTSPAEFSFLGDTENPVSYIWTTFWVFAGFFVFWPVCIYRMFGSKVKKLLPCILLGLLAASLLNVYLFKPNYGNLNPAFKLDNSSCLSAQSIFLSVLPFVCLVITGVLIWFVHRIHRKEILGVLCASICLAELILGFSNIGKINSSFSKFEKDLRAQKEALNRNEGLSPVFHLSRTEKNVVVLFLDRAVNFLLPYVVEEFPELKEQYSGFKYYPNTLSFSTFTLLGFPGMAGGYEYSIPEINARSEELLRDKHTEACLVMPVLFQNAGYDISVFDPPNTNYHPQNDLSVYSERGMHAQNIYGAFVKNYLDAKGIPMDTENDSYTRRHIRDFSILQMLCQPLRFIFYNLTMKDGMDYDFEKSFGTLYFMNELTDFENEKPSFIFIDNQTNHEYRFLNAPDFDEKCSKRDNSTGSYKPHDDQDMMAYHMLASSMKSLGKWMDYLKENGCYDNTRIIIVSDHGWDLEARQCFEDFKDPKVPAWFNPLLMVKDFGAGGELKTDNAFMTNADTVFLAKEGLPVSDVNPFTGKKLVQNKENGVVVVPARNLEWLSGRVYDKTQFTFDEEASYTVKENIFKKENWVPLLK